MKVVGRFAPSPSGLMHMGNVFAYLVAYLAARSAGGEILLRMEDLDAFRCTNEFAERIRSDLRWLGLNWDREQPQQRYNSTRYAEVCEILEKRGLTFPCCCTRCKYNDSAAPHASDGHTLYPGTCRNVSAEARAEILAHPHSTRLIVPDETITFTDGIFGMQSENLVRECGDFVIRKADGSFAYQLAVVVDDADGGVTQVVRGHDLLSSVARQIYLFRLLGAPAPDYMHIPMLTGIGGRKLSKRDSDLDLTYLRRITTPEKLIGRLAFLVGMTDSPAPTTADELISVFNPRLFSHNDIEIDPSFFLN